MNKIKTICTTVVKKKLTVDSCDWHRFIDTQRSCVGAEEALNALDDTCCHSGISVTCGGELSSEFNDDAATGKAFYLNTNKAYIMK